MEKLESLLGDTPELLHDGFVHAHLSDNKKKLIIQAMFNFRVALVNDNGRPYDLKNSHIKLRNGSKVPLIVLTFHYTPKDDGYTNLDFAYDADLFGSWDFIKVKFLPKSTAGNEPKKILTHVKGSTVHYGDTD